MSVHAYLMQAFCPGAFFCLFVCLFVKLGGTYVLFIDLQDVKWDLCECVTVEQRQAMLFVSGFSYGFPRPAKIQPHCESVSWLYVIGY